MGLGGALMAHHIKFIEPNAAEPISATFLVWVMLVVAVPGNNRGAVFGAILIWTIWSTTEILSARLPPEWAVKSLTCGSFLWALHCNSSCSDTRAASSASAASAPLLHLQPGSNVDEENDVSRSRRRARPERHRRHRGEVTVGSAAAVTGPIAELVVAIVDARNLAANHVNEQGGLLGGDTYQLVQGDSQCDPKAAVDVGAKLVNVEQAVAVIGPSCSGATNGMGPVRHHPGPAW